MLNRKYFPFERNNYYFGKLLTAKDFEAEQTYINDKRRLMNRLNGANGIVAGLGVIMADDCSIILQAGCALDASGREIIVPETKVIKLPTIEGFSRLSTNTAYLGISYSEQQSDEVYSVMSGEDGTEKHNKVREQYKLSIIDRNLAATINSPIEEFVTKITIYSDSDVEIIQYTPKFVPLECNVNVRTQIRRIEPGTGEYSFGYKLQTPGFVDSNGSNSIDISISNKKLSFDEIFVIDTVLTPESHIWGGTNASLTLKVDGFSVQKNDEIFNINRNFEATLKPVESLLNEYYLQNYYSKSMDETLAQTYDERLWIAKINLIRQNNDVIVDSVSPAPYDQYSYNPQQLMMLERLKQYYPQKHESISLNNNNNFQATSFTHTSENSESERFTSSGVFDFPLGLNYDTRKPLFSDEIMHGLGKGAVYVDIGVEYITTDSQLGNSSEIILGNTEIFAEDNIAGAERIYDLSTAVKVLPDRGTFVVGIKPNEVSEVITLRVRWYAFKLNELSKTIAEKGNDKKMIVVNPDTVVLQPKGTAHIAPVFINMPSEPCTFTLQDEQGGEIDNSGVYTAPSKEGVYEIKVQTLSDPTIYTHVFAIVTQKKKEK